MGKKILVVDDELIIVKMLEKGLSRQGYEVSTANDGVQALHRVRQNRPDLIILDIMMPNMDGTEVAGRLREEEETKAIPIIFLSALWDDQKQEKGVGEQAGLNVGIAKPFQLDQILAKVRELIG